MEIFIKKYLWVVNLIGVMLCSFFLAKIASVVIADRLIVDRKFTLSPVSPVSQLTSSKTLPPLEQYQTIATRNIFDSKDQVSASPVCTPDSTDPACLPSCVPPACNPNVAVKTGLPIKLLSTFSMGEGIDKRSSAVLQVSSGSGGSEVYAVDDMIKNNAGVKITKILPERIEFMNGGRLEYLELERLTNPNPSASLPGRTEIGSKPSISTPGILKQGDNKFVIDQAEIDHALANLNKTLTEARIMPADGKATGVKLVSLTPTSLFAKLGLQRGDVLDRINGVDMDMTQAMQLFTKLKGEKRVTIDLTRNGQKQTFDYEIR